MEAAFWAGKTPSEAERLAALTYEEFLGEFFEATAYDLNHYLKDSEDE